MRVRVSAHERRKELVWWIRPFYRPVIWHIFLVNFAPVACLVHMVAEGVPSFCCEWRRLWAERPYAGSENQEQSEGGGGS